VLNTLVASLGASTSASLTASGAERKGSLG
jgi:hypothetical protein